MPADDPMTAEKAALGRQLFHDRRIAEQPESSCADCHIPEHGFAGREAADMFHRNAPTVLNRAYGRHEFWDGSAPNSLEGLVAGVLRFVNSDAHRPSWERLNDIPAYREAFQRVFGREADELAETQAIATFCRTLLAGNAPFDRGTLSAAAQHGRELFFGKAACASCHAGPNFTDEAFHDIGIGQEEPLKRFYPPDPDKADFPELGRFNVTGRGSDRGAFKTPTLRELESTGPYMHDGRFSTLDEVVDYFDRGGQGAPGQDPRVHRLSLTSEEREDLVAFLHALSSGRPAPVRPLLP